LPLGSLEEIGDDGCRMQVGQRQLLDAVKVPRVFGNKLVVPLVLAGIGIEGDDGANIKVVETFR